MLRGDGRKIQCFMTPLSGWIELPSLEGEQSTGQIGMDQTAGGSKGVKWGGTGAEGTQSGWGKT